MFYKLRARVTHVKYTEINLMGYSLSTEIAKVSNCCYLMRLHILHGLFPAQVLSNARAS